MHKLVCVLVPGITEDDALAHAGSALDALVGIGMDNAAVFDYYKTFDEPDARFRPYVATAISDVNPEHVDEESLAPAFPIDSDDGQALLGSILETQSETFRETFSAFQEKLDDLTIEDVMNGVDGARFTLQQLAEYEGASVSLYNEVGGGLSSPKAVTECVDRIQRVPLANGGGTIEDAAATEDDEQTSCGWIIPADVHY